MQSEEYLAQTNYNLGVAQLEKGNEKKALEYFKKCNEYIDE